MQREKLTRQLIASNSSGKISTTKFWYNIACLLATCVVGWYGYHFKLAWEMFGLYLVSVGGFSSLSKYLNSRFQEPVTAKEGE